MMRFPPLQMMCMSASKECIIKPWSGDESVIENLKFHHLQTLVGKWILCLPNPHSYHQCQTHVESSSLSAVTASGAQLWSVLDERGTRTAQLLANVPTLAEYLLPVPLSEPPGSYGQSFTISDSTMHCAADECYGKRITPSRKAIILTVTLWCPAHLLYQCLVV